MDAFDRTSQSKQTYLPYVLRTYSARFGLAIFGKATKKASGKAIDLGLSVELQLNMTKRGKRYEKIEMKRRLIRENACERETTR
jgi:hypothetical protein